MLKHEHLAKIGEKTYFKISAMAAPATPAGRVMSGAEEERRLDEATTKLDELNAQGTGGRELRRRLTQTIDDCRALASLRKQFKDERAGNATLREVRGLASHLTRTPLLMALAAAVTVSLWRMR